MKDNSVRHTEAHKSSGVTLIELLNLVAIIGIMLALLLPAIQRFREEVARMQAQDHLEQMKNALQSFHGVEGQFPPDWSQGQWHWPGQELLEFCQAHPQLCSFDVDFLTGRKDGYSFLLFVTNRSAAHAPAFQILAEPISPGITASDTLIIDQEGDITTFQTPGADEARRHMLDNLRATGAETITELLNLDRSALPVVGEFVERPETVNSGFNLLDSNDNNLVSIDEILNPDTGSGISMDRFFDSVSREMRLDLLSPEQRRAVGVGLSELRGYQAELFSFDGICSLTRQYISAEGVADHLCAMLRAAKAAAARGDSEAKARLLRAYMNEVEAQAHSTLTRRRATTLITLAETL